MTEENEHNEAPRGDLALWRLEQLEKKTETNKENIDDLKEKVGKLEGRTNELKVYITHLLTTMEGISGDLKDLGKTSDERHDTQQEKWTQLFQKFTYLVLGALIAYLFSQL